MSHGGLGGLFMLLHHSSTHALRVVGLLLLFN